MTPASDDTDKPPFAGMEPMPAFRGPVDRTPIQHLYCRVCGAMPAAPVEFRAVRGIVLVRQHRRAPGPYCRTCGIATFRHLQADTLAEGWWSLGAFVLTPFLLLTNASNYGSVSRLPDPIPGFPGKPLAPGRPVTQRPQMLMLFWPLLLAGLLLGLAISTR